MKLSIIVPIYNVSDYLEECLDSIYSLKEQDYEVILVNDGSTDNSLEIITHYYVKFPEKTIVINQENRGLSGSRNSGLQCASGEYIAFIDSDDIVDASQFEHFVKSVIQDDLDIGLGEYSRLIGDELILTKSIQKRLNKSKVQFLQDGQNFMNHFIEPVTNNVRVETWVNLYKRDFLMKNNLSFVEKLLHEDTLFFFRAFSIAKKVKYYPIVFYWYRERSGSIMANASSLPSAFNKLYIIDELLMDIEANQFSNRALNSCLVAMYFSLIRHYKIKNKAMTRKILSLTNVTLSGQIRKLLIIAFQGKATETVKKIGK